MSKLFAYALVLGSIAGVGVVAAAGCASNDETSNDSASALTPLAADAGDAGSGPVLGSVVISQVYGGGGRDGATFNHDFVEIFNRSAKAITLDGMSLQLSASATSSFNHAVPLTGSLAAGAYLLVQLGTDDVTVGGDLPVSADLTDDAQIGSATDGKVAIALTTSSLNCGAIANLCATAKLMDLVGYGQALAGRGTAERARPRLDPRRPAREGRLHRLERQQFRLHLGHAARAAQFVDRPERVPGRDERRGHAPRRRAGPAGDGSAARTRVRVRRGLPSGSGRRRGVRRRRQRLRGRRRRHDRLDVRGPGRAWPRLRGRAAPPSALTRICQSLST